MRICLDVSQSVYEGTGSGRYVIELVKSLLSLSDKHEYVLFGSASKKRAELTRLSAEYTLIDSVSSLDEKYVSFPPTLYELLWNTFHVLSIDLIVGTCDIYHSSDWTQAPSKARLVTTVHDLIPFLFPQHVHPRIRVAHEARWKHIIADGVHIIVDAQSTKQDILNQFHISPDYIDVIPLACAPSFYQVGKAKLTKSIDYHEKLLSVLQKYSLIANNYILAVGTLEPRKNIDRLVEAYHALPGSLREEVKLVVVGKKAWADEIADSADVLFTGYIEDADLPYVYSGAKAFVMPSLYEGFGLPVLEAMACGTPVICSNRSSLPEIGGDDVHYIQEPEEVESIRLILSHVLESEVEELDKVAQNGYNRAMEFSWRRTALETLAVYKKLL